MPLRPEETGLTLEEVAPKFSVRELALFARADRLTNEASAKEDLYDWSYDVLIEFLQDLGLDPHDLRDIDVARTPESKTQDVPLAVFGEVKLRARQVGTNRPIVEYWRRKTMYGNRWQKVETPADLGRLIEDDE